MIKQYIRKPAVIEAMVFEYNPKAIGNLLKFCGGFLGRVSKARHPNALAEAEILTLEDGITMKAAHIATEGDYIIKGIRGEYYAVKPDLFKELYEEFTEVK